MVLNYLWNFGDQTLSNANSPSHVYENIGSYFVELNAENNLAVKTVLPRKYLSYLISICLFRIHLHQMQKIQSSTLIGLISM